MIIFNKLFFLSEMGLFVKNDICIFYSRCLSWNVQVRAQERPGFLCPGAWRVMLNYAI